MIELNREIIKNFVYELVWFFCDFFGFKKDKFLNSYNLIKKNNYLNIKYFIELINKIGLYRDLLWWNFVFFGIKDGLCWCYESSSNW